MTRWASGSILCFLLALPSMSACSRTREAKPPETFTIGVVTWVGSGPYYLARDKGLFDGLPVDIRIIDDAAGRRAALARGSIVAMAATVDDFANAAAAGLPGVAILKTDDSYGGDGIVASAEIKSPADLKGKSIAFPQGMPSHFFLLDTLKKSGLSTRDLSVHYMEAGEAGAAFVAGKVDAAVTWEPWLSKSTQRAGGHVLRTTRDAPGLISDIVVANREALQSRRADFLKFVRGWFAAVAYAGQHPVESDAIMAKSLNLSLPEWHATVSGMRLANREENLRFFGLEGSDNEFQRVFTSASEIWKAEGLVAHPAAPEKCVDSGLVAQGR
jgi:NitT/TauT family transport system substrate-binding protein